MVKNNRPAGLTGKWFITQKEHMNILGGIEIFPDYCNGPFEIATTNIIEKLYMKSYLTKVFFIDDAFKGLLANKIKNVTYLEARHYSIDSNEIQDKTIFFFTRINVNHKDYYNIWNQLLEKNKFLSFIFSK